MNFIESAKRNKSTLESFKPVDDEKYAALLRKGAGFGIAAGLVLLADSAKTFDVHEAIFSGLVMAVSTFEAAIHLRK